MKKESKKNCVSCLASYFHTKCKNCRASICNECKKNYFAFCNECYMIRQLCDVWGQE